MSDKSLILFNGKHNVLIVFNFVFFVSTPGYGHISPSTKYGRSFCIVYALIGIPICGILLSALGEEFKKVKDKILNKVNKSFKKKWQRNVVSILAVAGIGMSMFIVIPAIIFQAVEGWTYHEAWYYCFITLTTVGFGDFVPGRFLPRVSP